MMQAFKRNDSGLWRVDDLVVDARARTVTREGAALDMPRLSLDFLLTLVEAAPDPVSSDELMERVWRGAVVSPTTVAKRAELLRQALGDASAEPRYVALERGYGYRLVPEPQPVSAPAVERAPGRASAGRRLLVLAAFVAASAVIFLLQESKQEVEAPPARSLAVLPFKSLGDDPADQQFADGLTEELGHALARSGQVRVTGRKSSFRFRDSDEDAATIGAALHVAYLLEGTVRRSANQLRVVATLTGTSDGVQRWTQAYDREMSDLLDIQREIAENVAAQLQLRLGDTPPRLTESPEAYALYLKAVSLMDYPFGADLPRAQQLLEQAVALDPDFARAWSYLATAHLRRRIWNERTYTLTPESSLAAIRDALDRSLAANPDDGVVYSVLAALSWSIEDDIAKAARLMRQYVDRNPWWNDLPSMMFAADLSLSLGNIEQALDLQARVLEHDPLCDYCRTRYVTALNALGRHDQAMEEARLMLQTQPENDFPVYHLGLSQLYAGKFEAAVDTFSRIDMPPLRHGGLAMAYHSLGDRKESSAQWQALQETRGRSGPMLQIMFAAAWLGYEDEAYDLLGLWIDEPSRRLSIQLAYTSPVFEDLRGTDRWNQFLERIERSPRQLDGVSFSVRLPRESWGQNRETE